MVTDNEVYLWSETVNTLNGVVSGIKHELHFHGNHYSTFYKDLMEDPYKINKALAEVHDNNGDYSSTLDHLFLIVLLMYQIVRHLIYALYVI